MTHPLYTPTARSPKVISFEPLQRGADAAEAAIRAAEDQLVSAMKAEEARAALYAKRDQLIEEPSDLPGGDLQGGEQRRGGAIPDVVMGALLGMPGLHRQRLFCDR
jgi:hypothetical protein